MPFNLGWVELLLVLVIVAMLFGVGKLPEVFGAVGKGIREFRKESGTDSTTKGPASTAEPTEPTETSH
jgi:sec-independent protein translocase protein TatA